MPSDYLLCQRLLSVEQSSNIASIRSTSKPSFFPRSRFEPLKIRAESFELMSVVQRLTRNCNKRQKKKSQFTRIYQRQIDEAIHETVTVRSAWIWFWSCSKPKSHLGDSLRFSEAATFSWRTITNRTNYYCDFHNECQIFVFCSWKIIINATGAAG